MILFLNLNSFSLDKGAAFTARMHYTINDKSYNIHTFFCFDPSFLFKYHTFILL